MASENDTLPATVKEAVDEIIANYKSLKPPFVCPIDRCAKPCLGLMSLKHHLLKIHKERLLQGGTSDDGMSDEASEPTQNTPTSQNPNTSKEQPGQSLTKRKLKRKRKRWSTVRKPRPTASQLAAAAEGANGEGGSLWGNHGQNETVSPSTRLQNTVANMTYEESLRVSMFEVDGRTYRVEIDEPLKLEFVEGESDSPPPVSATTEQDAANKPNQLQKPTSISSTAGGARAKAPPPKKLPEAEVRWFDNYAPLKVHKVPKEYRQFEEKTAEELDREVEYVMDDLDYSWLRIYNAEHRIPRCLPEVSSKDFELLMDRLEKDSRYEPVSQLGESGGAGGFGGSGGVDGGGVIGCGDSTFEEDDAVCCICQDGEAANTNVILFCDMCNLPVHQECYGVPYIPEGQWVCRKCLLSPSQPVSCQLCPIKTGAFKQTSKNKWCHVSCALWIPEVHFANAVFLEPIENIENIPSARFKLCCYICKKRNAGASIQCSKNNCFTAFHIACGQSAGLHIKLEPVKDPAHSPTLVNVKKVAYCDVHTPADSDRKPLINSNPDDNESKEDQKRKSKKLKEIFAQKQGAQIQISLPEIPAEKYEEIVGRVDFPAKVQFLTRLTSYWLLRRQALNGVPLIKRLHMNHLQKQQQKTQAAIEKCENDNKRRREGVVVESSNIKQEVEEDSTSAGNSGDVINPAMTSLMTSSMTSGMTSTMKSVMTSLMGQMKGDAMEEASKVEPTGHDDNDDGQNMQGYDLTLNTTSQTLLKGSCDVTGKSSHGGFANDLLQCASSSSSLVNGQSQTFLYDATTSTRLEDSDERVEWKQYPSVTTMTSFDLERLKYECAHIKETLDLVVKDLVRLQENKKKEEDDAIGKLQEAGSSLHNHAEPRSKCPENELDNEENEDENEDDDDCDEEEIVPLKSLQQVSASISPNFILEDDLSGIKLDESSLSPSSGCTLSEFINQSNQSASQMLPSQVVTTSNESMMLNLDCLKKKRKYRPRRRETDENSCAARLRPLRDNSLWLEYDALSVDLDTIEGCCQTLTSLRYLTAIKQSKLYHCIAQGNVLNALKRMTDSEKHLDNVLKSRNIQLESTQRNNFVKLYRFYLQCNEICNYNVSSSYVLKNFQMVKAVFEKELLSDQYELYSGTRPSGLAIKKETTTQENSSTSLTKTVRLATNQAPKVLGFASGSIK